MGGYVNVKTFDHGDIKGQEVSVAFELYSDVHQIARSNYQVFPSEKPAYATVFEKDQRDAWVAKNAEFFVSPTPTEPTEPNPGEGEGE